MGSPSGGEQVATQFVVLVVCANIEDRRAFMRVLNGLSSNVFSCSTLAQADELISRQTVNLVFCDEHLSDGTYRDLLSLTRSQQRTMRVVVITHVGEWKEYLEATHLGAFDVIPFPLRPTDVELTVIRAMHGEEQKAASMTA